MPSNNNAEVQNYPRVLSVETTFPDDDSDGTWTIQWERGRVKKSRTIATRFIPVALLAELKRLLRSEG